MGHQADDLTLQNHKPMFNVTEPSIIRAQFASNRDISFSSYLQTNGKHHPSNNFDHQKQNKTEDSDQISIFDAAKYFSGIHDNKQKELHQHYQREMSTPKVLDLASMARLSSVSSVDNNSNYRTRSFHATPTASSEASWNSQTGLLANPPGYAGVSVSISPNSATTTSTTTTTTRWSKISSKWLTIPRRKCPCLGKKSVQIEERTETKTSTPRMVDLRRSTSSNGTNYGSSFYSTRQNSPRKSSGGTDANQPLPNSSIEANNRNFNFGSNNKTSNEFSSFGSNPKKVGPITTSATTTTTTASAIVTTNNKVTSTVPATNAFTFPILENQPMGVKKMFNVIPSDHGQDPHRDSLEVYQPRSHPSPKSRRLSYEEDYVSDGSSDLFEIESFSTSTYPRRDSLDEMFCNGNSNIVKKISIPCRHSIDENEEESMTPSIAPTEGYAPSEVSIDWSVTTAEGFDRASLSNFSISASEFGYGAVLRREVAKRGVEKSGSGSNGGEVGKRKGNGNGNGNGIGLLSCRHEKAISVGPGPVKCPAEGAPPVAARHVGGRPQQQAQGVVGRPRSSSLLHTSFAT